MLSNVHMMVQDPIKWIKDFIDYPINALTFHPEVISEEKCRQAFELLKTKNIKYGIALKFHIDAQQYLNLLKICDYVCVMSVEPGWGGQAFTSKAIDNLRKIKQIKDRYNPKLIIQLDGGVNFDVMKTTKSYTDHFVIGSFLMKQTNKKDVFEFLKTL
jgi:ribulose-phosphate 3-epimerase